MLEGLPPVEASELLESMDVDKRDITLKEMAAEKRDAVVSWLSLKTTSQEREGDEDEDADLARLEARRATLECLSAEEATTMIAALPLAEVRQLAELTDLSSGLQVALASAVPPKGDTPAATAAEEVKSADGEPTAQTSSVGDSPDNVGDSPDSAGDSPDYGARSRNGSGAH